MNCTSKHLLFVVILVLTSCGGGGGGDGDNVRIEPDDDVNTNIQLAGSFFFEWDHAAYLLSPSTGKFTEIPNTRWRLMEDLFPDRWATMFSVYPVQNNELEFLVSGYKCDGISGTSFTCLVVQDYSGSIKDELVVRDAALNPRLSQDGEYLSYFRSAYGEADMLEIRDRSGNLISEAQVDAGSIQWLPDNRLIYVDGRRFIFTYVNSAIAEYNLSLPGTLVPNGHIGEISLNPNATKLVFTLCDEHCSVYMMDIDGVSIRLLASVESGLEFGLTNPQWSPDGNWIYIKRGASAYSNVDYAAKARMYAVPSIDSGNSYILSPDSTVRSSGVIEILRYKNLDNTGDLTNEALAITDMYWIAK